MVVVSLRSGQDSGIGKLEPELLDAGLDSARRVTDTGVDQNVALRCGDQVVDRSYEPTQ